MATEYELSHRADIYVDASHYTHANSVIEADNGDLISAFQYSTAHSGGDGKIKSAISSNGGKSWVAGNDAQDLLSLTPTAYQSLNPLLCKAPNGDVLCFGSTRGRYDNSATPGIYVTKSIDNGATWSNVGWLNPSDPSKWFAVQASSGFNIGSDMYAVIGTDDTVWPNSTTILIKSTDNGATWSIYSTIHSGSSPGLSYGQVLAMPTGGYCVVMMDYTNNKNYVIYSDDLLTWGTPEECTIPGGGTHFWACDGSVASGTLFLHGRYVNGTDYFVSICTSQDGKVWSDYKVIEDIGALENGYTSSLVLGNNQLLVTYSTDEYNTATDLRSILIDTIIGNENTNMTGVNMEV